jgi:hypothetical protein
MPSAKILNIISRHFDNPRAGAVQKVGRNLSLGLKRIGYPFVVNKALDSSEMLFIQDDYRALIGLEKLDPEIRIVIGPNLFVMPRDIPRTIHLPPRTVYLQPSEWVANAWRQMGYDRTRLDYWPAGIDTQDFPARAPGKAGAEQVLFYYKHRDPPGARGAEQIVQILQGRRIPFERIDYGNYRQEDFLKALGRSRYVIWYGRQESQGLALQEALAMGCPLIVIEVANLGDYDGMGYQFTPRELEVQASAAPYFDERCGVKIASIKELDQALTHMDEHYATYDPRSFIAEKLSLEVSARNLLSKFGVEWPEGARADVRVTPDFKPFIASWRWVLTAVELRYRQRGLRGLLSRR